VPRAMFPRRDLHLSSNLSNLFVKVSLCTTSKYDNILPSLPRHSWLNLMKQAYGPSFCSLRSLEMTVSLMLKIFLIADSYTPAKDSYLFIGHALDRTSVYHHDVILEHSKSYHIRFIRLDIVFRDC
jgi:hypothetical protein